MTTTGIGRRFTPMTGPRAEEISAAVERVRAGERASVVASSIGMAKSGFNYWLRKAGVPKRMAPTVVKSCAYCGNDFTVFRRSANKKSFCAGSCRNAASSERQRTDGPTIEDGYRMVLVDGVRMREHIAIAERALGRALRRGEVVHHINGNKLDNRSGNLLVCSNGYHAALHARMSYLYQREKFGGLNA